MTSLAMLDRVAHSVSRASSSFSVDRAEGLSVVPSSTATAAATTSNPSSVDSTNSNGSITLNFKGEKDQSFEAQVRELSKRLEPRMTRQLYDAQKQQAIGRTAYQHDLDTQQGSQLPGLYAEFAFQDRNKDTDVDNTKKMMRAKKGWQANHAKLGVSVDEFGGTQCATTSSADAVDLSNELTSGTAHAPIPDPTTASDAITLQQDATLRASLAVLQGQMEGVKTHAKAQLDALGAYAAETSAGLMQLQLIFHRVFQPLNHKLNYENTHLAQLLQQGQTRQGGRGYWGGGRNRKRGRNKVKNANFFGASPSTIGSADAGSDNGSSEGDSNNRSDSDEGAESDGMSSCCSGARWGGSAAEPVRPSTYNSMESDADTIKSTAHSVDYAYDAILNDWPPDCAAACKAKDKLASAPPARLTHLDSLNNLKKRTRRGRG